MNSTNQRINKAVIPYYGVACVWVLYSLLFSLYSIKHYLVLTMISVVVFVVLRVLTTKNTTTGNLGNITGSTGNKDLDSVIEEGNNALRDIRRINDSINDPAISEEIDKIEVIIAKIFNHLKEKPDKLPQARRFLNYFLPTTLKILEIYSSANATGISGKNIDETKRQVLSSMDLIVKSLEKQLDNLFTNEAIDVSSEITVLETMLRQEGMIENPLQFGSSKGE